MSERKTIESDNQNFAGLYYEKTRLTASKKSVQSYSGIDGIHREHSQQYDLDNASEPMDSPDIKCVIPLEFF